MRWTKLLTGGLLLVAAPFVSAGATAAVEARFAEWLRTDLWPDARAQGVSSDSFEAAFRGVEPDPRLPDLVVPGREGETPRRQHQAEFRAPGAYFAESIVAGVVRGGRQRAARHADVLAALESRYGVPRGIVLAVWGRESAFGTADLPHNAFEVLATKAFMARRKQMYRAEVIAALLMVERGVRPAEAMKSSWGGALGQPQFLPTSYLRHAVSFAGGGAPDIWESEPDTLASIAGFLADHGWVRGRDWGFEVTVPEDVSCAQEGPDRGRSIADWARMGVERVGGRAFPEHERDGEGYLMLPAGRLGPAFLVTPNFYVLKDYNESDLYALFVGHAGDRIMHGQIRFSARWRDVAALSRGDIAAMQRGLERQGYDVGGVDGLAGFRTRRSIGAWQESRGATPTCFPDAAVVQALR